LDNPAAVPLCKMTNRKKMRELQNQPMTMKAIGYYPCKSTILYELQYCDPRGLNHSLPPDTLHAILLGYFTHLINEFVRLRRIDNDNMFVFSDTFKEEVELAVPL